jgi:hypothetical protein
METGNHLDPQEGWGAGNGESFAKLQSLLELVREENRRIEQLSPERRERIRERLMERLARNEVRRRRRRVVLAAVGAALVACAVVTLVVRVHAG